MAPNDSPDDRLRVFVRVWTDALAYGLTMAVLTGIGALTLGIATGGGLVRAKVLLFAIGWVLLAYAVVRLWPTTPDDVGTPPDGQYGESLPETHDLTRFQAFVRTLPPVRWVRAPPPEKRVTVPGKLLFGGLLILLLSFLMEAVFGVG
ncbi:DUF7555 family protein [Natrinema soli]|uniref:Uncharacterized protein n=1 Tax=Natrinema soli TaxID=1930624 RepID=A0ABD5SHL7_9EURY|nr:hypothetical protein [Natrinema soli]